MRAIFLVIITVAMMTALGVAYMPPVLAQEPTACTDEEMWVVQFVGTTWLTVFEADMQTVLNTPEEFSPDRIWEVHSGMWELFPFCLESLEVASSISFAYWLLAQYAVFERENKQVPHVLSWANIEAMQSAIDLGGLIFED